MMTPLSRGALILAITAAVAAAPGLSARADDDGWRHDNGRHRGWHKHHHRYEDWRVWYGPAPIYVGPPPPVYVAPPPPPVYYAPVPLYAPPTSLNIVVPLKIR
jgi:hypothetical protein